jgi:gamma-glutamyl:cysteine ligase YbdK (ATP-grasp superfamily)
MAPLAQELGLTEALAPLVPLLAEGNQAMRWRERHRLGESIAAIISSETAAMQAREHALEAWLATDAASALG